MASHSHHHHHGLEPRQALASRKLLWMFGIGALINLAIVALQITFGILGNSVALLTDAAHNFTDVLGMLLALVAVILASREPSGRRTFGFKSFSLLAAFLNAVMLYIVTGVTVFEALRRLSEPPEVAAFGVLLAALVGGLANLLVAYFLKNERKHGLNTRSAFAHMVGDAALSLGVVGSSILIGITGLNIIDPLVSLVLSTIIVWRTWPIFKEASGLILHQAPDEIDIEGVESYLRGLPGVVDLHELHVWALSDNEQALMVHLVCHPHSDFSDRMRWQITNELRSVHSLEHVTIQIEHPSEIYLCHLQAADHHAHHADEELVVPSPT